MIDKRANVALTPRHLEQLLSLSEGIAVINFYVSEDPKVLVVQLAGEPLAHEVEWVHPEDDIRNYQAHFVRLGDLP